MYKERRKRESASARESSNTDGVFRSFCLCLSYSFLLLFSPFFKSTRNPHLYFGGFDSSPISFPFFYHVSTGKEQSVPCNPVVCMNKKRRGGKTRSRSRGGPKTRRSRGGPTVGVQKLFPQIPPPPQKTRKKEEQNFLVSLLQLTSYSFLPLLPSPPLVLLRLALSHPPATMQIALSSRAALARPASAARSAAPAAARPLLPARPALRCVLSFLYCFLGSPIAIAPRMRPRTRFAQCRERVS